MIDVIHARLAYLEVLAEILQDNFLLCWEDSNVYYSEDQPRFPTNKVEVAMNFCPCQSCMSTINLIKQNVSFKGEQPKIVDAATKINEEIAMINLALNFLGEN